MKYRVTINMHFDSETDAQSLMTHAKNLSRKAVSVNEGALNEEIGFCEIHKCYHDEYPAKSCEPIERVGVKKIQPVRL